jgi:hypothetical protein
MSYRAFLKDRSRNKLTMYSAAYSCFSLLSALLTNTLSSLLVIVLSVLAGVIHAETAPFDLAGPGLDVRVRRGDKTLSISEVPNLEPGDRLWVHPKMPDGQSVHYLMVVAFLRGATNPPPDAWFTKVEIWNKPVREEGIVVTVPEGAQEALVFFAPETGGGFNTLRATVRGKPGTFVRASQDLIQASLDRARLDKYLSAVREMSISSPSELHARTVLLAGSLGIQLEQYCFDKPTAQQVPCLTQNTDQLVLDDAHSQTMASTLTSGSSAHLVSQITSTPLAGAGSYSPYIGAVLDMARILATAHTAQYQYIPALALLKHDVLSLRLNSPPSFRNPKSVLVVSLPPVRSSPLPPLRAVKTKQIFCAEQPELVLSVEGAPLVFATELAHGFFLHVQTKSGDGIDLPARADAANGGFIVDTRALQSKDLDGETIGVLRGFWGFRMFDGPRFRLRSSRPAKWTIASKDASALIVGREDVLHLQSTDASCVDEITVKDQQGKDLTIAWTMLKPDELEVKIPLQEATAGWMTMVVRQFGMREPDQIVLHTYAEASRLDSFVIHAGDDEGLLKGTRLDEVTSLDGAGIHFKPVSLSRVHQQDQLKLSTQNVLASGNLHPGDMILGQVNLKDGRVLELETIVEASRPKVTLLNKSVQLDPASITSAFRLGNAEDVPQDSRLQFSLKVHASAAFAAAGKIQVATSDEFFHVFLSMADGNLVMQDSKTVFAVLDPMKHLGPSAFGSLKFRAVDGGENFGDWQPLANLVRVPALKDVHCAADSRTQCRLNGEKLFLIDSVATDPEFANSVTVPDGFVDSSLPIPSPKGELLYIKLRDDPSVVAVATVPVLSIK